MLSSFEVISPIAKGPRKASNNTAFFKVVLHTLLSVFAMKAVYAHRAPSSFVFCKNLVCEILSKI